MEDDLFKSRGNCNIVAVSIIMIRAKCKRVAKDLIQSLQKVSIDTGSTIF